MFEAAKTENPPTLTGDILRYWRRLRRVSQMDLALDIGISTRHLSFVENGRSRPSRDLVLRLAESLNLPFRQRNALLQAAGYAAEFSATPFDALELGLVQQALRRLLAHHEPYPGLVVNTAYEILLTNTGFDRLVAWYTEKPFPRKYGNLYRMLFAEDELWRYVKDWPTMERFLLARLLGEIIATQNESLRALYKEMVALRRSQETRELQLPGNLPLMSFTLQKDGRNGSFFSMLTTFGTPLDVTTQELRIELFFPADKETERLFAS